MAVWRQLQELMQDPQPFGAIVMERAPAPGAAAWIPPPSSPPLSSASPAAAAEAASPLRRQSLLPEGSAVFLCRDCWTVLGDSLQLCASKAPQFSFLVCFKVTSDVIWEDSLLISLDDTLLGCAYNELRCRSCGVNVGFMLYSATSDLAHLRGLFCFFKDRIICYLLGNQMIIDASEVDFPTVTFKEQVQELKEKLVEFHLRIEVLMKKLEELERNHYVTEWQRPASDTDGPLPGYAREKVN